MKRFLTFTIFFSLLLSSCGTIVKNGPTITSTISNTPTTTLTLTASLTPTITSTHIPTPSPTITPTPLNPLGQLVFHKADHIIDYDWFSYVPFGLDKKKQNYILLTGLHGNIHSPNYNDITQETRKLAEGRIDWANGQEYILLVPSIPKYFDYQPIDFDLTCFYDSTNNFYRRPDLRVNLMIDRLMNDLQTDGYIIAKKVFIEGFSSGGMFAQRYALLHPERVQAIAAGQCGGTFVLPESSYEGTDMNWPVGINNFSSLVGYDFNIEAYKQIYQFIFIGDQDTTNSTLWLPGSRSLWSSQSQIDFLKAKFGETDPVRLENQILYLKSMGFNRITFKLYTGVGHIYTSDMVDDLLSFFRAHK